MDYVIVNCNGLQIGRDIYSYEGIDKVVLCTNSEEYVLGIGHYTLPIEDIVSVMVFCNG